MTDNELLMQFQADILSRNVVRPTIKETTALGVAYAAGLAVGFFKSVGDLCEHWSVEKSWSPTMPGERVARPYTANGSGP